MREKSKPTVAPLDLDHLAIVMVSTRNPLNLGAAARAMSNFGFGTLRVVRPYEAAFREARSAVGAAELLAHAREYPSVADAVADCALVVGATAARHRTLQHPLRPLERAAPLIRRSLASGRVALLFGSEKRGLSNDDLSHCHWLVRVPTSEVHPSLNLGQAVAISLYELIRHPARLAGRPDTENAKAADLERLGELMCEALRRSGYTKPGITNSSDPEIRRLVRRLQLSTADVKTLLGMLRQIVWRLTTAGNDT